MSDDVRQLCALINDSIEDVADALSIRVAKRTRRMLYAFAPWDGHHRPKLEIEIYPRAGRWNDWAGGLFGDGLDLIACTLTGGRKDSAARGEALRWARGHFGLGRSDPDQARALAARAEAARRRAEARQRDAATRLERQRAVAFARWREARPLEPTRGQVRGCDGARYLEARGIPLDELPRLPRAVRFSPQEDWFDDDGVVAHTGPALVTAMTLAKGAFAAMHRIWIDPTRPGEKADLNPPRKIWPNAAGSAMRLWRGAKGLKPSDAAARVGHLEDVVVCEGVEDGLSIAWMTPELRVDAAGSLPGLLAYEPYPFTRSLIIAADNDWDRPQAVALLERAVKRLRDEYRIEVRVARSPSGKDFNDLVRGHE
ncbi:MAG: toprim domain-containing protein [Brevundimonas sp.]|uniref:DUF7146 domain-containing protein n=1 Tax=Brevundimonas sp. TaxID=1871086 RepID=UPI00391902CB